jgi:hypothetical protein
MLLGGKLLSWNARCNGSHVVLTQQFHVAR